MENKVVGAATKYRVGGCGVKHTLNWFLLSQIWLSSNAIKYNWKSARNVVILAINT